MENLKIEKPLYDTRIKSPRLFLAEGWLFVFKVIDLDYGEYT